MKKSKIHPRNKYQGHYDLDQLIEVCPDLQNYMIKNHAGEDTLDFSEPDAVRWLNKALLLTQYNLSFYEIPKENLCPPIPGRADYIHYVADLLAGENYGEIPKGKTVNVLDVGCGANCIYPILGVKEYDWNFVATDIYEKALAAANEILTKNEGLSGQIELRLQKNSRNQFRGAIKLNEKFQLSVCNPPFHASAEDAAKGTTRKLKNLHGKEEAKMGTLNFGGISSELWCEGGEKRFVQNMIHESSKYKTQVTWFTTLVSKEMHLKAYYAILDKYRPTEIRTIPMGQGNKSSRILAWTFRVKKKKQ